MLTVPGTMVDFHLMMVFKWSEWSPVGDCLMRYKIFSTSYILWFYRSGNMWGPGNFLEIKMFVCRVLVSHFFWVKIILKKIKRTEIGLMPKRSSLLVHHYPCLLPCQILPLIACIAGVLVSYHLFGRIFIHNNKA